MSTGNFKWNPSCTSHGFMAPLHIITNQLICAMVWRISPNTYSYPLIHYVLCIMLGIIIRLSTTTLKINKLVKHNVNGHKMIECDSLITN